MRTILTRRPTKTQSYGEGLSPGPAEESRNVLQARFKPVSPVRPLSLCIAALLLAVACDDDPAGPVLKGGILATFAVSGETFKVFVTNQDAIADILALQSGTSDATIPNGAVRRGSGLAAHNRPWSWHMDPEDISMAEATIELCDGRPSLVEADIDTWVDVVGRFCPWGAELVSVEDLR